MKKFAETIADEILSKYAVEDPTVIRKAKRDSSSGFLPAYGGAVGGGVGRLMLAGQNKGKVVPAINQVLESSNTLTPAETKRLARKLLRTSGIPGADKIPIHTSVSPMAEAMGPHYMPKAGPIRRRILAQLRKSSKASDFFGPEILGGKEYIHVGSDTALKGRNPFIAAHEVGHATPANMASKFLRAARINPLLKFAPTAMLLGGGMATDSTDPEISKAVEAAPWVAGADALATQGEELRASLRGRQLLRQSGHAPIKNFGKMLGLQQLNYGMHGLGSVLPILGGSLLLKAWHNKKQKDLAQSARRPELRVVR